MAEGLVSMVKDCTHQEANGNSLDNSMEYANA